MIKKEQVKKLTLEEKEKLREEEIKALREENETLRLALQKAIEQIKKLEGYLSKNSKNSSKPPSSDGFKKPNPKSLRKRLVSPEA